jgi:hypothetical protein
LTSALVGGEWSASRPARFTPGQITPGTHWIGGRVSPRGSLDDVENTKFLAPTGLEFRPLDHPGRFQSLSRLRYPSSRYRHNYLLLLLIVLFVCIYSIDSLQLKYISLSKSTPHTSTRGNLRVQLTDCGSTLTMWQVSRANAFTNFTNPTTLVPQHTIIIILKSRHFAVVHRIESKAFRKGRQSYNAEYCEHSTNPTNKKLN